MSAKKLINLLPQEEFETSLVGRVLRWATGTFRIIVILTELVVMGAFLSRFWLDAKNSDLNELIEVKSAQISSQSDFEKEFRNLQKRVEVFKKMSADKKFSEILAAITSKLPPEVSFSSLSLRESAAQIKGVAKSELAITQFMANLEADQFFKEVSLEQISQSENNPALTVFALGIKY